MCDITHEWVPYLFCVIGMCDSNVSTLQIASKPIAPCEQFHKNTCIKLLSHAEQIVLCERTLTLNLLWFIHTCDSLRDCVCDCVCVCYCDCYFSYEVNRNHNYNSKNEYTTFLKPNRNRNRNRVVNRSRERIIRRLFT